MVTRAAAARSRRSWGSGGRGFCGPYTGWRGSPPGQDEAITAAAATVTSQFSILVLLPGSERAWRRRTSCVSDRSSSKA